MARDMVLSRLPDTTAPSQIEHLSHVPQKLRQITRVTAGKKPEETVAIIDSQSTRTTEEASIKGFDAGKKRREGNDTSPLTQWDCWLRYSFTQQEAKIGMEEDFFSPKLATNGATFTKSYADGDYAGKLIDWAKLTWDIDLEIVKRA